MQCKYPGCNSTFAKTDKNSSWYGYCFRHGQKLKLVSKEEQAAFEEKRGRGIAESWKRGGNVVQISREKAKEIAKQRALLPQSKEEAEAIKKKEEEEAQKIIHALLGDEDYDAGEVVKDLEEAGGADFKFDERVKRMIFMQWFLSDPKTRKPVTMHELCRILKMSFAVGRRWMESDWFVDDLQGAMQKSMKLAMPYIARVVLGKALSGEFNSIKEFVKLFGKHEKSEAGEDWNQYFNQDVLQEAAEIADQEN